MGVILRGKAFCATQCESQPSKVLGKFLFNSRAVIQSLSAMTSRVLKEARHWM